MAARPHLFWAALGSLSESRELEIDTAEKVRQHVRPTRDVRVGRNNTPYPPQTTWYRKYALHGSGLDLVVQATLREHMPVNPHRKTEKHAGTDAST